MNFNEISHSSVHILLRGIVSVLIFALLSVLAACSSMPAQEQLPPFSDVHLHYNWDQAESLTPAKAIQQLRDNNITLAVVSSTPPELALALRKAGGPWVVPFFRPYLDAQGRHRWFVDDRVLPAARQALASGQYYGIGEFHLIPGIGPRKDNEILHGLISLAIEYKVPVLIHTEASDPRYFQTICQRHPQARFLWAHAGGLLSAAQVATLLEACPNVWVDMSARDNYRYILTPVTDSQGLLLPEWIKVISTYPDRFMTGADPVWPVEEIQHWSTTDSGWSKLTEFVRFHRRWMKSLPVEVEEKVRHSNAIRFFSYAREN